MNTVLFKSWHAIGAGALALGFTAWWAASGAGDRTFQLASGWAALALILVVLAYVLRKYVHKLGISPEFRMRVPIERLEKAESRLAELRARMVAERLEDAEVLRRGRELLKQEGVHRVVKVRMETDPDGARVLRALPTGPLGSVARWMRVHLYYGIAAGVLVLLHGRISMHSGMGVALNLLSLLTIGSGLGGIWLWATGPRVLTDAERELSIERAHALRESLDRKVDEAYTELDPALKAILWNVEQAGDDFPQRAKAALAALPPSEDGGEAARDLLALLGQRQGVRREWEALMRVKQRMHRWRVLHIPGAILLMTAVVVHVFSVLWY